MTDETIEETFEFFGIELKIKQIANPHLKRVITDKKRSGYNNHSRFSCHSEHSEYFDHREKYHEYSAYGDQYWNSA